MKGKLQLIPIKPFSHLLAVGQYLFQMDANKNIHHYKIKSIGDKDMNLVGIHGNTNVSINTSLYQMVGIFVKTQREGVVKTTTETRIYPIIVTELVAAEPLFELISGEDVGVDFSVSNIGTTLGKLNNGYIDVSDTKVIHKDLFDVATNIKKSFISKEEVTTKKLQFSPSQDKQAIGRGIRKNYNQESEPEGSVFPVGTKLMVEIEITNPAGWDSIVNPIVENIVKGGEFTNYGGFRFASFSIHPYKKMVSGVTDPIREKLVNLIEEIDQTNKSL